MKKQIKNEREQQNGAVPVRGTRREPGSQSETRESLSEQRPASATPYRAPKEQTKQIGPKQRALNEALRNVSDNVVQDVFAGDSPLLRDLMQQYAQRAETQDLDWNGYDLPKNFINSDDGFPDYKNMRSERQGNIAPGSIDPSRDTVYRVGADDPYGYYSQSQLNNGMSGPDANAIYQATHRQNDRWIYGSPFESVGIDRQTPQEYNDWLREEGYLPHTGRQLSMPVYGDGAYVSGADAWSNANYDDILPAGVGSVQGIPREYLSSYGKYLSDIDRSGDWYDRRTETIQDWMDRDRLDRWNSGRGKNW